MEIVANLLMMILSYKINNEGKALAIGNLCCDSLLVAPACLGRERKIKNKPSIAYTHARTHAHAH